jgi:ABC-type phosphate transport system substrate-binding protein
MRAHLGVALLLAVALAAPGPARAAEPMEVLIHADHAGQGLDREELRAIFMMRVREWPDGRPIRVFVLRDDHELHDAFVRQRLGTFPYVLRGVWDRMVYTGTGLAPTVVGSETELRERVRATPGAIGYQRAATARGGGGMR